MSEYLQNVGRRAKLRQEDFEKCVEAKSHIDALRLALDPLTDPAELDEATIMTLAAALSGHVARLKEIRRTLQGIEDIIGK